MKESNELRMLKEIRDIRSLAIGDADSSFETGVTLSCDRHGDYPERKISGAINITLDKCPSCQKEENEAEEERIRKLEKKIRMEKLEKIHQETGVSPRNYNMRFEHYIAKTKDQMHVYETCNDYAKRIYKGEIVESMIITGKVGTGKTMIATCIINSLYRSKSVRIIKLSEMLRYVKSSYSPSANYTEHEAITKLSKYDLLVIDEVGVSRETDNDKNIIFDVIDGRYQNMLPTVIVSNLSMDGIKESLGERVIDRLRDGGGILLGCDWESFRK